MKTNIKQTSKIITALLIISAAIFINNQLVLDSDAAETTSITQEIVVRVFDTKPFAAITNLSDGDYIMFGKESAGIPEEILLEYEESCVRIPMLEDIRSLNLSNSVAIVLYEALRQQGFKFMQTEGDLHRLQWKGNQQK